MSDQDEESPVVPLPYYRKRRETDAASWYAEGEKRFGPDRLAWPFACPLCGHVATGHDWKAAGAPEGSVGFSCIGRWKEKCRDAFATGPGPCNYTGGGLFQLNPVQIKDGETVHQYFEFAEVAATVTG